MVTRLSAPRIDFAPLRREFELPTEFPPAAQREADEARDRVATDLTPRASAPQTVDRTDVPFVTIDPATSRDLDQALSVHRREGGYRVLYAIADVSLFVPLGGELEAETWRRGQTVYLPDGKVPLHPVSLSEGAASLLPGETRPAALWTIDLDQDGATTSVHVERAIVRSRAKLDYEGVSAAYHAGTLVDPIALLPEVGALLVARSLARGAINLPIPEQELEPDNGGWRLVLRSGNEIEDWNAQISLLTGIGAATIMLDAGLGLLRTMPAPRPEAVAVLRKTAPGLGVSWPDGATVGQVLAEVDPGTARGAAFIDHAAELMRGAGYTAFDTERPPAEPPKDLGHGAVASPYAHVTAPLRRLADRYATEVCLAVTAGSDVPDWVRAALPRLPEVMTSTDRRASAATRAAIDLAEAVLLHGRVGEEFDAAVIDVDAPQEGRSQSERPAGGMVALDEPPVRGRCLGALPLGDRIRVRLVQADPATRTVRFEAA